MSRMSQPRPSSSKGGQGSTTATVTKVSRTTVRQGPSAASAGGGAPKKSKQGQPEPKDKEPAYSTLQRLGPKEETEYEKFKKKTMRRNAPAGEDLKQIKETIKGMRHKEVTVQEFVGSISQYTGDNGAALRAVMADELSTFRKIALSVYDNMTQDVSDVLANEQQQLSQFNQERIAHFSNKMMRTIDEIYELFPTFDFERYYRNPNEYLAHEFKIPEELEIDPEEIELHRRQLLYHRLQWLRAEGERLHEENKKLQARLTQLKREQQEEQRKAANAEYEADQRRQELEATQEEMQDKLEELNNSVEKSIVENEKAQMEILDKESKALLRKQPKKKKTRSTTKWNEQAATEIETASVKEVIQAEMSQLSVRASKGGPLTSKEGAGPAQRQSRTKMKRPPKKSRDASPFHFSPIKTPPDPRQRPARDPSPFHYSPPRTPPEARQQAGPSRQSPSHAQSQGIETLRVESTTITTEPARALPKARRSLAPRDSWGGYQ